jgi:hypothetical protein
MEATACTVNVKMLGKSSNLIDIRMKSEHGVKIDDSPTPCSPNLS